MKTAKPAPIDLRDPDSFARFTFDQRLPAIVAEVEALSELSSSSRSHLSSLRQALQGRTVPSIVTRDAEDESVWERCLAPWAGATWLELPFFEAEVVFYRALIDATRGEGPGFDPFGQRKRNALESALPALRELSKWLENAPSERDEAVSTALDIALRGNVADLSQLTHLAAADPSGAREESSEATARERVLVDDRGAALRLLNDSHGAELIDVALDNAGAELASDLVLLDVLLRTYPRFTIRVHCKPAPFFVSDVTAEDWRQTLRTLASHTPRLAERLQAAEDAGRLRVHCDRAWCWPLVFEEFPEQLFATLAESRLLVLKGDLQYRRYVEDRSWPHTTPARARRVAGLPPTLALRVLKSDVAVGLAPGVSEALAATDPGWLHSSRYAMMQLFE